MISFRLQLSQLHLTWTLFISIPFHLELHAFKRFHRFQGPLLFLFSYNMFKFVPEHSLLSQSLRLSSTKSSIRNCYIWKHFCFLQLQAYYLENLCMCSSVVRGGSNPLHYTLFGPFSALTATPFFQYSPCGNVQDFHSSKSNHLDYTCSNLIQPVVSSMQDTGNHSFVSLVTCSSFITLSSLRSRNLYVAS